MTTPESIAASLPNMTIAEVRDRLAAGQSPEFIRDAAAREAAGLLPLSWDAAKAGLIPDPPPLASSVAHEQVNATRAKRGLPPLPPPMPIGEFVAWAFKEHDTTLRALAEQEREDAAREEAKVEKMREALEPPPVDPSHEWMLIIGESALGRIYREEVDRSNREQLAIIAGQSMPGPGPVCAGLLEAATRTFDASAMSDEELRRAA